MTTTSSEPTASGRATAERLRWPDVAKGACILLVVLHHVVLKHYIDLVPGAYAPVEAFWHDLTYALKPIRMPLFFAVSGFFAASAVTRPWVASARRIASSYYLYLVWLVVFAAVYAVETDLPANRVTSVADLVGELLWAASSLWFLYALAVYLVIAKALRALPPGAVVAAAAVLAVSVSWLGIEENNRFSVLLHLVYFLAGAYFPQSLRWLAEHPVRLRLLLPAYGAGAALVLYSGLPWSPTAVAASLVGIPLGISVAVRVQDSRLGAGLAWVGRRTLRVYVLHLAVLVAVVQLPLALGEGHPLWLGGAVAYPLVLTGLVATACFGAHAVLVRTGFSWLFELPVRGTGQPGAKVPSVVRSGIPA